MKKLSFISAMLAMVLVFGLAFMSCENEAPVNKESGDDQLPGPGVQIGQGSSWPSSSKLAEYSLVSWNQPEGLGGITWTEWKRNDKVHQIRIEFTSVTAATKNSINNFLEPWATNTHPISDSQTVSVTYEKLGGDPHYSVIVNYELATGGYIVLSRYYEAEIDPLS